MKEKIIVLFRCLIGYSILISSSIFLLMWNFGLWLIYAIEGFSKWSDFFGCLGFSVLSILIMLLIDILCTKILPKNFDNLRSILFE